MEEIKKAEETARDFLENKLKTPNPTSVQMDIMTRIVISNNGTMILDKLLSETKEVLIEQEFYHPEIKTILNWMLAIATNKSVGQANNLVGVALVGPSPGNGLIVNY